MLLLRAQSGRAAEREVFATNLDTFSYNGSETYLARDRGFNGICKEVGLKNVLPNRMDLLYLGSILLHLWKSLLEFCMSEKGACS